MARRFWLSFGDDEHQGVHHASGAVAAEEPGSNPADASEEGDLYAAIGALHTTATLGSAEFLGGLMPWLQTKEGCSEYFRELGQRDLDPCRPIDGGWDEAELQASVRAFLAQNGAIT